MSQRFSQLQTFTLAGAGASIGDATLTLSSFQTIDAVNLAMTDFGTKGWGTIEPSNSTREEQISFTGVTQNSNGTATLTGVKNVTFTTPYTETAGMLKSHPGGSQFIITNTSGMYSRLASKDNDETVTGTWTFENNPVKSGVLTPVGNDEYATKKYVDDTATGTTIVNGIIMSGNAYEVITIGKILYQYIDGSWRVADGLTDTKSQGVKLGIALTAGTTPASINVLLTGQMTDYPGLVAGSIYYLGTTGSPSATKSTYVRTIGRASSTTSLLFEPTNDNEVQLASGERIYAVDTSATPDYVELTCTPAITAYKEGQVFVTKIKTANTGATTMNVNALGNVDVKKNYNSALVAGDLLYGQIASMAYCASPASFQLQSPGAVALVDISSSQSITGVKSFSSGISLGATPLSQTDGANKNYVDYSTRLYVGTCPVSIANDATETVLMSTSITGGTIGKRGVIRGRLLFDILGNASSLKINLNYGGVQAHQCSTGVTKTATIYEFYLMGNGYTNAQLGYGYDTPGLMGTATPQQIAVDSTATQEFNITAKWNAAAAGNIFKFYQGYIEKLQ